MKSFIAKSNKLFKFNLKTFSGGHDHHHISGKVDMDKIFVPQEKEFCRKMISLRGLATNDHNEDIINECDHKENNKFHPLDIFSRTNHLANIDPEQNPYLHEEPYGYLMTDDVS